MLAEHQEENPQRTRATEVKYNLTIARGDGGGESGEEGFQEL